MLHSKTFLFVHLVSVLVTLFTLFFTASMLRGRRPPGSALLWIFLIVGFPYFGLPAYLILGRRKLLPRVPPAPHEALEFWSRIGAESSLATSAIIEADGVRAFNLLEKTLLEAQESILFETFIFKWDETGQRIFAALLARAESGVHVRLLLDGFGQLMGSRIAQHVPPELRAKFEVGIFSPALASLSRGSVNLRNHRKLVVVDGKKVFVGGMNVADEYMGPHFKADRWQDFVFVLEGSVIAPLMQMFRNDWLTATGKTIVLNDPKQITSTAAKTTAIDSMSQIAPATAKELVVEVAVSGPDQVSDPIYNSLLRAIACAQKEICIVTPYFVPDEALIKTLTLSAAAGISVKIIIPFRSNHPMTDLVRGSALRELQKMGASLYFYPKMIHAKLVTVDQNRALIGSANLDIRSLFVNYELGLWIENENFVRALNQEIAVIINACSQSQLSATPLRESIEGLARLLSPML